MTNHSDVAVSRIAAAIGEPARARILYYLLDGRARTSTELAVVAQVSPSTASVHLGQLTTVHLINVVRRGKYRYYSLDAPDVAQALEALAVLAGDPAAKFVSRTPGYLRDARTCYDHMAGRLGVLLHNRFKELGWLTGGDNNGNNGGRHRHELSPVGASAFGALGIDLEATRRLPRRFAYGCLDWSERQPHLAGALGAAVLKMALQRKWVIPELDCRALSVTKIGNLEMERYFGFRFLS